MWALFVAAIALVSVGLGFYVKLPKWGWIGLFAGIAILECALISTPSQHWSARNTVALWTLDIIIPWLLVAILVFATNYPQRAKWTALSAPLVYFVSLGIGLLVGDATGLVPQ
jgi:hypothetical protein